MSKDTPPAPPPWTALSFLALQLLDHWGNRKSPRPAPRADLLTAALGLGEAAAPAAATVWAQRRSAYAAQLVQAHLGLAAENEDTPGCGLVTATTHATNLQILRTAFGLAAVLLAGGIPGQEVSLPGNLTLRWAEGPCCRLHPWPLVGSRLTVRATLPDGGWRRWQLLAIGAPS
ncbi:MAG TPA: hypothetical protein PLS53_10200 [Thermoanaerobaculaceae bacterium]|nr:hypothetical protein [Thermoanaerobaculaceae bacterium]HPS78513.1 hypothetical protein [Thermoanaerobaculaceae bacterium]